MQKQPRSSSLFNVSLAAAALVTILAVGLTSAAPQSAGTASVYPTSSMPFGKSYADWTTQWWKWALARPVAGHPFIEPGFDCNSSDNGQSGPVWFLATTSAPPVAVRSCTIPADTAVMIALANVECSSLETPEFPDGTGGSTESVQRDCATFYGDHIVVSSLFCSIDGHSVANLGTYRFGSSQFTFTAPSPWIFGDTGGTGTSVGDGYYVMFKPPSSGSHTVTCGGSYDFGFGFATTYRLRVRQ